MSFYVVVNSDANVNLYPENNSSRFCIHFTAPLTFKGLWSCALVELELFTNQSTFEDLYIQSDICAETYIDGVTRPLCEE